MIRLVGGEGVTEINLSNFLHTYQLVIAGMYQYQNLVHINLSLRIVHNARRIYVEAICLSNVHINFQLFFLPEKNSTTIFSKFGNFTQWCFYDAICNQLFLLQLAAAWLLLGRRERSCACDVRHWPGRANIIQAGRTASAAVNFEIFIFTRFFLHLEEKKCDRLIQVYGWILT